LGSAVLLGPALVAFPIGSPFLSIPMGALTWFFVGTLHKLAILSETPKAPALASSSILVAPPARLGSQRAATRRRPKTF